MLYKCGVVQDDMKELISKNYIPFELLKGKTILVTGAAGMLACYFVYVIMYLNRYFNYKTRILALVRREENGIDKFEDFLYEKNFCLLVQDVCDEINIKEEIHYIVHAAGASNPYSIKNDPVGIILANTRGTRNVLELARQNPIKKVLFTSTREVYGKIENIEWIKESDMGILDPLDTRSCYPESKRMAEQLIKSYQSMYQIPFNIVRIAHSYGPGMRLSDDGRVMSDFISDIVNNRSIVMKSGGNAVRAFCYLTDAVAALFAVLLKGRENEAYNVANETEPYPIREVAERLVALVPEKELHVVYEINQDQSGYCQYQRVGLNTEKLEQLGWTPKIDLTEGMQRTLESFWEQT